MQQENELCYLCLEEENLKLKENKINCVGYAQFWIKELGKLSNITFHFCSFHQKEVINLIEKYKECINEKNGENKKNATTGR